MADDGAGAPAALITGGAGGIGTAMARALTGRGYRVMLADIDLAAARRVADEVGGAAVEVDVSDLADCHEMVARTLDRFGRLDLVALNAGVNSGQRATDPLDPAKLTRTVGINLLGVVHGIDAVVPALTERGGSIVVTASLAALAPEGSVPLYTLSKAGVVAYVRSMAPALHPRNITVNALCPGFVDTPMISPTGREILQSRDFPLIPPEHVAEVLLSVVDSGATGEVWAIVAGQPPTRYEYPPIPPPLHADGTPVTLQ